MKLKQLQFVICVSVFVLGVTYELDKNKILNGIAAPEGKYPSQVSLQYNNGLHFCGGSILNADYVLTSAACIDGTNESSIRVVSSMVNLKAGGQVHQVLTFIGHENFMDLSIAGEWVNDIALIKVDPKFDLGNGMEAAVILPNMYDTVHSGEAATLIGWGETSNPNGVGSEILLETNLTIINDTNCEVMYGKQEFINQLAHICAGASDNKGVCLGDSGGPLFVRGVLVGVASFTNFPCGTEPGVFTEVANYIGWIWSHAV